MKIQVKIKKLREEAVIPAYAHATDAGLDLVAVSKTFDDFGNVVYGFGLAVEIPEGFVGLLFPRSSIFRENLDLSNSVGVIDSGYRGEIQAKFKPALRFELPKEPKDLRWNGYQVGERVVQLVVLPCPRVEIVEVEELSESDRGERGFGSTGK